LLKYFTGRNRMENFRSNKGIRHAGQGIWLTAVERMRICLRVSLTVTCL